MLGRGRTAPRLDPVRWRRPDRTTVLRLAATAALLGTAATLSRPGTSGCRPGMTAAPGRSASAGALGGTGTASSARASPDRTSSDGSADRADPAFRQPTAAPGEPLPRQRVPTGTVGVPVRLADPAALRLVRAGDLVDLLRLEPAGGRAAPVADGALVLAVSGTDDPAADGLLLALRPAEAAAAVAVPPRTGFAVLVRPDR